MSIFVEGQEVKALYFNNEDVITVGGKYCDKITVSMENGQMAGVKP